MARVHLLVKAAVERESITIALLCEECGAQRRLVAHHDDYARPLDVRWLCLFCHSKWHVDNGPGLNRELAGFYDLGASIPPKPADPRREEMKVLRRDGWTLQKIGNKYGFTREYVRQIVGSSSARQSNSEKIRANILEIESLRNDGKTVRQIAGLLGFSCDALSRASLPPRVKPKPIHGVTTTYTYHRCRCDLCREANAKRTSERTRAIRMKGLCVACKSPSTTWHCDECNLKYL